ncbi:MAG: NAD(P)/FAD-dependent oxidoreductase [Oscillospiraceae bacterium]|nr:NAD(P)/FAD-dependent oxidoreductase [Oscillospiraceae bacterium]
MKKAAIVGAGLGGLTIGALLARDGWKVSVYDKNSKVGGVCALAEKNGYKWEQGPLILGDMLPGESVYELLASLGIRLPTVRADRGIEMPDYPVWHHDEYEGPYWRRDYLKKLFPEDAAGIDEYYRLYDNMMEIRYLSDELAKRDNYIRKLRILSKFFKIRKYTKMTAQELVEHLFTNEKLHGLFTGIFCDFCASPAEVQGLGVVYANFETAFDKRIPLKKGGKKYYPGFVNIVGGVQKLPEALAEYICSHGGEIKLQTIVDKVLIENNAVRGVRLSDGTEEFAEMVVGSGGGRDFFYDTVGRDKIGKPYQNVLDSYRPMEAVFMVHLGVDFDPMQYMKSALCYYYKCYDIPAAVEKMRSGIYHEGEDGYLIYVPTAHAPEFAPEGKHCVTIYTVAPDTLAEGDWESKKEYYADKLIKLAEQQLPGLSEHITEKLIMTAIDYREMTHMKKCSFGGVVPIWNQQNPGYTTSVDGLYFVGQQSESAGGVGNVINGAKSCYDRMKETWYIN